MLRPSSSAVAFVSIAMLAACAGTRSVPGPKSQAATSAAAPKGNAPSFGAVAIDAALREEWKRAGVSPAPRADDATFLRRAYVDLAGTVPTPEVISTFLADTAPDKRARLVDALLASPEYVEHWTNYWDGVLMGREARANLVDRATFRSWLRTRFAVNAPWDRVVRDLVSATGQNGFGGPKLRGAAIEVMPTSSPVGPTEADDADSASVNGAVNWTLRFEQNLQDLGGSASRVFLGLQIQCAQCHDHKTESWKQEDFRKFSSAFFHAKIEPIDRGKTAGTVKRVELADSASTPPRFAKNAEIAPLVRARATALDGTDLEKGVGTRKALAEWMTSKDSRWFARAFVNRMWGHLLGRGFYDPVDDIRPSNPAIAPEVLDRIAAEFAAHDFDIKHLLRTICATEVYGLAASASAKTDPENKPSAKHASPQRASSGRAPRSWRSRSTAGTRTRTTSTGRRA